MFSPISFWKGDQYEVIDIFSWVSGNKKITLESDSFLKYIAIFDNADVDIDFDILWNSSNLQIFGIFIWNVKSKFITSILANYGIANVRLFCVVKEGSDMRLDWSIVIGKNIENVEGHLIEEQFLLGNPKNLIVSPILDVNSSKVKSSHAAKIHALDPQKLFYMMSKWLSLFESQKIVVKAWLQSVFDQLLVIDEDKKQKIFEDIINAIF